jgi:hypothetical protein
MSSHKLALALLATKPRLNRLNLLLRNVLEQVPQPALAIESINALRKVVKTWAQQNLLQPHSDRKDLQFIARKVALFLDILVEIAGNE